MSTMIQTTMTEISSLKQYKNTLNNVLGCHIFADTNIIKSGALCKEVLAFSVNVIQTLMHVTIQMKATVLLYKL